MTALLADAARVYPKWLQHTQVHKVLRSEEFATCRELEIFERHRVRIGYNPNFVRVG